MTEKETEDPPNQGFHKLCIAESPQFWVPTPVPETLPHLLVIGIPIPTTIIYSMHIDMRFMEVFLFFLESFELMEGQTDGLTIFGEEEKLVLSGGLPFGVIHS